MKWFHRGHHRVTWFSTRPRVDDLRLKASRPGWYQDARGNWCIKMNCRVFGVPEGQSAYVTIAPPGGIVNFPWLPLTVTADV